MYPLSAAEKRKEELIQILIDYGIFKINNRHLHELTLREVEDELNSAMKRRSLI